MKKSYSSKLELANHLVEIHGLPKAASFAGLDQYGRMMFDVDYSAKSVTVATMSELVNQCNFVDRMLQGSLHLVQES